MSPSPTHYETLQVTENAGEEVIKGAYRFLSQKWHPDKNPQRRQEAQRTMQAINEAYSVLSDPDQRRAYDDWLGSQRGGGTDSAPPPQDDEASARLRAQYVKDLSNVSAQPFGALCILTASLTAIAASSRSPELRELLFGAGFIRFGMVVVLATGGVEFLVSRQRKKRLDQEDLAELARKHARYRRKRPLNLLVTWVCLLAAFCVLLSYRTTLQPPSAASGPVPSAERHAEAPPHPAPSPAPAPLIVRNDCGGPVEIVIHHRTAQGQWQTTGAYALEPGQGGRLATNASNGAFVQSLDGVFYYYAESADGQHRWAGDEANPDDKSVAGGDHLFRFRKVSLERNGEHSYALTLNCDGARPRR